MLTDFGVEEKPTTAKNPTANAIFERMNHAVGDILREIKAKIADEDEAEQASSSSSILALIALSISPTE